MDGLGRGQELRCKPSGWITVPQFTAEFEALHEGQESVMHVRVDGILPEAFTIVAAEAAEFSLDDFIIEYPEHGLGGPLIASVRRAAPDRDLSRSRSNCIQLSEISSALF